MIIGLKIRMDRPVDRERPCCRNICIISAGKGPHAGTLNCADCSQRRGGSVNQQRNAKIHMLYDTCPTWGGRGIVPKDRGEAA